MSALTKKVDYLADAIYDIRLALLEHGISTDMVPLMQYGDLIRALKTSNEKLEYFYKTISDYIELEFFSIAFYNWQELYIVDQEPTTTQDILSKQNYPLLINIYGKNEELVVRNGFIDSFEDLYNQLQVIINRDLIKIRYIYSLINRNDILQTTYTPVNNLHHKNITDIINKDQSINFLDITGHISDIIKLDINIQLLEAIKI